MRKAASALLPATLALVLMGSPVQAAPITLGTADVDFGPPSSFFFAIAAPLDPGLTGLVSFTGTIDGTLADATGDGMAAYVVPPSTSLVAFSIDGTEVYTDPLGDVTASFGPLSFSGTYDGGVVGCTMGRIDLGFLGTGGGDQYSFSAVFEVTPLVVPEPATTGLVGITLAGLVLTRRRQR